MRRLGLAAIVWAALGCGHDDRIDDRSTTPRFDTAALETVAELPQPPGNVAVSRTGRVFFTFHAIGKPDMHVAEWVDGRAVPFPDERAQSKLWDTPLSLRIDRQDRLWVLDDGGHGFSRPKLIAYDLATDAQVHEKVFRRREARAGSMLNDFQVDPTGRWIYIADTSFVARKPALVVYDVQTGQVQRRLQKHATVRDGEYRVYVDDERIEVAGSPLWFGVDSIALDREGQWLYYAAVNAGALYRVKAVDLRNPALSDEQLAQTIERYADITLSDGLTTDDEGGIYVTDMEHAAVHRVGPDRRVETLLQDDALLRWPDGLGFGPDGWVYVTASALQVYLGGGGVKRKVRRNAPYHIVRFKPGFTAEPGH